jgi:ribosomal protein L39E
MAEKKEIKSKIKTERKEAKLKEKTERKEKKIFNKKKKTEAKAQPQIVEFKRPHVSKRQRGFDEKKAKLAVKARQTKWAPVWVVMKKYGPGKRIHPSATTAVKRSWRRTKLHIKPRRIKKWHLG